MAEGGRFSELATTVKGRGPWVLALNRTETVPTTFYLFYPEHSPACSLQKMEDMCDQEEKNKLEGEWLSEKW